ncbi:DUF4198 domain-containing protein [Flavobacteriaceae bacterium 3-367]
MRKLLLLLLVVLLCSHDLYIKMESYFLQPDQEASLSLYNGTFEKSENTIARDRILDASVVAQGQRRAIDPEQWKDQDSTITQLTFTTGEAGTYVAGVSTKARNIALTAENFNSYLEHDGVLDMLEQRKRDSVLDKDAVERYEKHVKAIYQVGETKTNDWSTVLGYPIEFVPQANPYERYSGETLEVQLLLDGKPLSDQLVQADYLKGSHAHDHAHADGAHSHKSEKTHTHTSGQQLRSNDQGVVVVQLPEDGIYYLRTIHMTRVTDSDELTHWSKWATLTFEVGHKHGPDTHTHDHDIPTWVFIVGSLLIMGVLFLIFRKKN